MHTLLSYIDGADTDNMQDMNDFHDKYDVNQNIINMLQTNKQGDELLIYLL
jgi:hypothetical protein